MTVGSVNASLEAVVRLTVQGTRGQQEIEAVVDTGFSGYLTLPTPLIEALGLPPSGRGRAILADGSEVSFNVHEAEVMWHEPPRRVFVAVADTDPLVGMALLYGQELKVQVVDGGGVFIGALP
jgi:clan AA aspartic protease